MDITLLAQSLTAALIPFLPYLVKAGEKASETLGEKLSEGGWDLAKNLWGRLQSKFESKPLALEAAKEAAALPDDEDMQATFRGQLKKLLADDESLARELSKLLEEAKAAGVNVVQSGDRNVYVGGNVTGNITTGDNNK
ncbi:MAG: hypothetical protein ACREA2_18230 [Blastocatellia bacterium]